MSKIDLSTSPVHLGRTFSVLENFGFDGPAFESYIAEHCTDEEPGYIMMIETTPEDWTAWECHPAGYEIVHVLEGQGTFYQQVNGDEVATAFEPGTTLVNAPGMWHTADVEVPMKALYITAAPDTHHKMR